MNRAERERIDLAARAIWSGLFVPLLGNWAAQPEPTRAALRAVAAKALAAADALDDDPLAGWEWPARDEATP